MQILTQKAAAQEIEEARFGLLIYAAQLPLDLVYLLYWYKSANTGAEEVHQRKRWRMLWLGR